MSIIFECYELNEGVLLLAFIGIAIFWVQLLRSYPYFCKRCNLLDEKGHVKFDEGWPPKNKT